MTTVVCDRFSMSADSRLTDAVKSHANKIFKINGGIVGIAGTYTECRTFVDWLKKGKDSTPNMKNVLALVLTPTGFLVYESSVVPYSVSGPYAAIGSGAQAALAAMHLGCNTAEAVRVAAKIDPYTGGRIRTISI